MEEVKAQEKQGIGKKEKRALSDRNKIVEGRLLTLIENSPQKGDTEANCNFVNLCQDKAARGCAKISGISQNAVLKTGRDCVINTTKLSKTYYEQPDPLRMRHRNYSNVIKL